MAKKGKKDKGVLRYVSPKRRKAVKTLIRELGLEFVSVVKEADKQEVVFYGSGSIAGAVCLLNNNLLDLLELMTMFQTTSCQNDIKKRYIPLQHVLLHKND